MNAAAFHHPWRSSRRTRKGLSYVELVVASVSAGALLLGLASVLFTANKAFDAGDSGARKRIKSAEVLGDVMNDLRHATSFISRTANAVTFQVPDRNGDSVPETLSYSWSGNAGDPLMVSINGGPAAAIANDVHHFQLTYASQFMLAPQPPPLEGDHVLFVVDNLNSLSTYESGRETQLDNWGYEITLINASDPQTDFDAAVANHDVIFISADVADTDLGEKLVDTSAGVVSENGDLADEFGFAAGTINDVQDEITITTSNHYITAEFSVNDVVTVLDFAQSMVVLGTPASADVRTLGQSLNLGTYAPALVTLEPGDETEGGDAVTGRRVQLPWGTASSEDLTGEGLILLKRSVEWAAGAGPDSPVRDLLMIVNDVENLTNQELQRKAMLEEWGFKASLLNASETQTNIDAAVAEAEICYIHAGIDEDDLQIKLRHATIGIVSESAKLTDELGLRSGNAGFDNDEEVIDVVEKRHYITQFFPLGPVQVFSNSQQMCKYSGNLGDALELGNVEGSNNASLAVLETGSIMMGGYDEDPVPARRAFLPWGEPTFELGKLTSDGREILKRSLEWVGGANADIPEILFVVQDKTGLTGAEEDRQILLENFGYFVVPISDHNSQSQYNTAIAEADAIYICDAIDPLELRTKVTAAPIGVVIEEPGVLSQLGIADGFTTFDDPFIQITNTSHYITESFSTGPLEVYQGAEPSVFLDGNEASGKQTLGRHTLLAGDKCLIAIAAGDDLLGGATAAGRRVKLPWGDGFDTDELTAAGSTILERSLSWALGIGDDGSPDASDVNLGYEDIFASEQSLDNQQIAIKVTLIEDCLFTSMSGYFYDKDKKLRYAIYSDNNGEPGNLLAETEDFGPGGNGPQWTTLELPPTQLPAGTYWLAFGIDSDGEKFYYESDPSQEVRYKDHDPVGGGFLTSWGDSDASYNQKISIYATYTPSN